MTDTFFRILIGIKILIEDYVPKKSNQKVIYSDCNTFKFYLLFQNEIIQ